MHARLPVRGYGGTERVVVWLARGLRELGHRVTLLAGAGTRVTDAAVVPLDLPRIGRPGFDLRSHVPRTADIVHLHSPLQVAAELPHVFTLHGNTRPGRVLPPNTIYVSADHARRHGGKVYVHNGLDPAEYDFREAKADYDFFLGRLHGVKGYRWAIEGARRAGRRLVLAGGWRPSFRRGVRYAGTVDGRRKAELLAGAACLWMPALWEEPFGLTLIEALASGTPVLGTRRGALPEIVSPDVGALGDSLDQLIALRPGLDRLDPAACRVRVERHFTHRAMAAGYLRCYEQYLRSGSLPSGE